MDSREPVTPEARAESAAWAVEGAELRAEVHRLTAEERKWRHAGADGIDALADLLGKAQSEIERLTGIVSSLRGAAIAEAEAHAMIEGMLEAELGMVEPAEEPNLLHAEPECDDPPLRCECCGGPIATSEDAAFFVEGDESNPGDARTVHLHWGPCPDEDDRG